jgi:hypothetical protein
MKKLLVCAAALLLLFNACKTSSIQERRQRKCEKAYYKYGCDWGKPDTITTTNTVTERHDSLIYVPIAGQTVSEKIYPLNGRKSMLTTQYAVSYAWIERDSLYHKLIQTKTEIPAIIHNAVTSKVEYREKIIKVPYRVEVATKKPLGWFLKTLVWSGVFYWGLLIVIIVLRVRKFFV